MGYCTVDDVMAAFPRFVRNAPGSITDAQVQAWIEQRAARIRSVLLMRNIDPDAMTLSASQANLLKALNVDGTLADLAGALQATITTQTGELSLAEAHRTTYERVLGEIKRGVYDILFGTVSRVAGTAGAETDAALTPEDAGENRSFGKNVKY